LVVERNLFRLLKPNVWPWIPIRFDLFFICIKLWWNIFSVLFVFKLLLEIIINIEMKFFVRIVLISIGNGKKNLNERKNSKD
jgi:hypothetical protein